MWLSAGKLFIAGGAVPPYRSAVPFNGSRSAAFDRQLLDQRGINGAEQRVWDGPSRRLPSGPQLADIIMEPSVSLSMASYDLSQ